MDFLNRLYIAITQLHPIHPMVVHFPIALTGAAFLFILLAYWKKSTSLELVAFANITLAAISTVAASVTGVMDNVKNYEGDAPNAGTKMILGIFLFILTTAISVTRYRNPTIFNKSSGVLYAGAYGLSFGIALVLALLGGIILYGF